MTRHSPITGRFISRAAYRRWYSKGAPNHAKYSTAVRRWKKAKAEREEAKKIIPSEAPDYYEIEDVEPEFEATLDMVSNA